MLLWSEICICPVRGRLRDKRGNHCDLCLHISSLEKKLNQLIAPGIPYGWPLQWWGFACKDTSLTTISVLIYLAFTQCCSGDNGRLKSQYLFLPLACTVAGSEQKFIVTFVWVVVLHDTSTPDRSATKTSLISVPVLCMQPSRTFCYGPLYLIHL